MRIGLVTDSPSDLPPDLLERYEIAVVLAILVIEGQPYRDGIDITREDFYTRLPALRSAPTTAAPSPAVFAQLMEKQLARGCEHVLGIFTAEKLTSLSHIGHSAAMEFPGRVTVLESGSLSMGTGYQVLAAAEAIAAGQPLPAVLAAVQSTRLRLRIFAALDTVEYLRRSGRVPRAVAGLGGMLRIKPVVELHEGNVLPLGAPRTTGHANQKMLSLLAELGPLERLTILHTNAEGRAQGFLEQISTAPGSVLPDDVRLINVTTVIGTHVGPHGLGLAAVTR